MQNICKNKDFYEILSLKKDYRIKLLVVFLLKLKYFKFIYVHLKASFLLLDKIKKSEISY